MIMKHLTGQPPVEHLARPPIQEGLDMLDLVTRHPREVGALREELPDQPVGVFVGPTLPRTVRMGEEHADRGLLGEEAMFHHLLAPIVRERPGQLGGQRPHLPGEGLADAGRVLRSQGHQQGKPGGPLDEGPQRRGVAAAHQQVALPVSGHRAIGHLRGTLLDTDHVRDETAAIMTGSATLAVLPSVTQRTEQLPLEFAARQDVEVRVDRLMGHPHRRIVRILDGQPLGNLLRRPALNQARVHVPAQARVAGQLAGPPPVLRDAPCGCVRRQRPIPPPPRPQPALARPVQLPRDGAGGSPKSAGDRSHAVPDGHGPADLLALGKTQSRIPSHRAQLLSPGSSQDTGVALET